MPPSSANIHLPDGGPDDPCDDKSGTLRLKNTSGDDIMSDAMHVEDQVAEALLQKNIVVDQSTPVGDDSGPSYSEDLQMVSRYNNNTTGA